MRLCYSGAEFFFFFYIYLFHYYYYYYYIIIDLLIYRFIDFYWYRMDEWDVIQSRHGRRDYK